MLMKTQVLMAAASPTSGNLSILSHLQDSSSSHAEASSSAGAITEASNTQSRLSCSVRQPETQSSQTDYGERRLTRKRFTTFTRPSSATDADEGSALDQRARVESSSASVMSVRLKSILRKRRGVKNVAGHAKVKSKKVRLLISEGNECKSSIDKLDQMSSGTLANYFSELTRCRKIDIEPSWRNDDAIFENSNCIELESESSGFKDSNQINAYETKKKSKKASSATRSSETSTKLSSRKRSSRRKTRNVSNLERYWLEAKRLENNFRRYKTCFELGFKAEKILSAQHDGDSIYFLIKYKDFDEPELVPSHIVRSHEPLMVFDYYDQKFCWSQLHTNKYTQ